MSQKRKQIPFQLLNKLEKLKQIALVSENDAVKFYQNKGRNLLFDLEAICRILRYSSGKDIFNPYYRRFKAAEDIIGAYDYALVLNEEISKLKKLPQDFLNYFATQAEKSKEAMQNFLSSEGWLQTKLYNDLSSELKEKDYADNDELKNDLAKFIIRELDKIETAYEEGKLNNYDIEEGMHELRRKFRWISMYAQVANGWIQLRSVKPIKELSVYQTKEIIASPYNKLPELKDNINPLQIEAPHFYTLSWIINELGILKDNAMKLIAVENAIIQCGIKDKNKINLIRTICKTPVNITEEEAMKANNISDDFFFKHRIAKNIIRDIKRSIKTS